MPGSHTQHLVVCTSLLRSVHNPYNLYIKYCIEITKYMARKFRGSSPLCVTDADADGAPSTTQPGVPMTKKLLLDLYGLLKNKKGLKVLENVQIAALHVACMIKGTMGGNRLVGGVSPEPL
jgi:hypothetical protein